MKDKKELHGIYHRVTKEKGGLYGIETLVVKDGKVIDVKDVDPNYPVVTLSKFGKQAFQEASDRYDQECSTKV